MRRRAFEDADFFPPHLHDGFAEVFHLEPEAGLNLDFPCRACGEPQEIVGGVLIVCECPLAVEEAAEERAEMERARQDAERARIEQGRIRMESRLKRYA